MPNASHREQGAYPDLASLFEPYVWAWFQDTFEGPSPPQIASWPKIAEGKNTLIFSPTGSGKTLASFLWCINHLFKAGCQQALEDAVYVLYVSPLKALNNDIQKNLIAPLQGIKKYARRAGVEVPDVRSLVRTGDTTASQRAAMARKPPHILITTPESLYIILATLKFRDAFRTVRYVIVDEIHAISNNKRGVHLSLSLERLQHLVTCSGGRELVRIGLSATQKPLDEIAKFLVGMEPFPLSRGPYRRGAPTADGRQGEGLLSRPCEIVDVGARKNLNVRVLSPVDNLLEAQFDAIWGSSYDKMLSLIREHETTLIFSNSRYKTERTALRLNELSAETSGGGDRGPVTVGAHHGSMSKEVRLGMENKLKRGELDALVATASLELGIDVGSIDLVCQIQSPKSVSTGMQRIGRAGHLLHATSEGRLLVTDRDDLVESAVLVRAIMEGQIDTTRIPTNCLDVLAQQIVGAVAADDWHADDLYDLFRRSYCYRDLDREEYDRVLDLLSGNYTFDVEYPPYPKIIWDKVNNHLYPERGARLIAFRASGTIPDVADYDVYFESKQTRVGRLDEGFVEQLHAGDIFILGSSSWQVTGIRRNRVFVEDVYGRAPTIPFWGGDRDSRTYDLGLLVGQFRAAMDSRLPPGQVPSLENAGRMSDRSRIPVRRRQGGQNPIHWLQREYHVDENGAKAIYEYCREQKLVAGELPSHKLILVEHFTDELGLQQIVIHSSVRLSATDGDHRRRYLDHRAPRQGARRPEPATARPCQPREPGPSDRAGSALVPGLSLALSTQCRALPAGAARISRPANARLAAEPAGQCLARSLPRGSGQPADRGDLSRVHARIVGRSQPAPGPGGIGIGRDTGQNDRDRDSVALCTLAFAARPIRRRGLDPHEGTAQPADAPAPRAPQADSRRGDTAQPAGRRGCAGGRGPAAAPRRSSPSPERQRVGAGPA
jgi:ATP-dependent Lhr-like helicase